MGAQGRAAGRTDARCGPSQVSGRSATRAPPISSPSRAPSPLPPPTTAQRRAAGDAAGPADAGAYLWRLIRPGRGFPRESPNPRGGQRLLRRGPAEECACALRALIHYLPTAASPRLGGARRCAERSSAQAPPPRCAGGRRAGGAGRPRGRNRRRGPGGLEGGVRASPRPVPVQRTPPSAPRPPGAALRLAPRSSRRGEGPGGGSRRGQDRGGARGSGGGVCV